MLVLPARNAVKAVVLLFTCGLAFTPAASAGSGALTIRGSIDPNCNVQIQDNQASLNIIGGESAIHVGSINEYCNDKDGFRITFRSTNGGALVAPGGGRAAYELSYENTASWAALASPLEVVRTKKRTDNKWREVWVRMPPRPQAVAGSYWDTITVTIAAR